ncbi:hypothetical protein LOTGIDRAFT_170858 [Lottia gigantea]|uniref:Tetraspanin n=1 Tax=Lottia gigantea TaxID=225164 RepID=V4BEU7_LOTGI|nr:hypothetical protein LOTGIDRAFT_170858 [Lottia gigantea]ESP04357.1 hypothetical protein LOTGIDRAFT_170858 [Lottia gigantea]
MAAFARFSLIAMNLIFLVCGLAMFAFGLWMAVDDGYLNKFGALLNVNKNTVVFTGIKILLDSVQEASFVLMGCGLGILIIAILGFCGAIRQTVCSLLLVGKNL